MASNKEGGDNPFSFKAFISKREGGSDSGAGGQNTIEKKATKKKRKKDTPGPGEIEKEGDNPFSFKNFIKKTDTNKGNKGSQAPPTTNSDDDSSFTSDEEVPGPPPPLPILSDPLQERTSKNTKIPEPKDDIFDTSSDDEIDQPLPSKLHQLPLSDPVLNVPDPLEIDQEDEDVEPPLNINPFPEVAMIVPDEGRHDLLIELNQVKAENDSLKKQVTNLEKSLKKEKGRSQSLKDEIKLSREKEAKDAKALEDMIQKVEDNLKTATQRSMTAEATIVKLKSQVQSLQTQLAQANPQVIHKSYEDLVTGVRDKANFASQQLRAAALKADVQLKELCQGIETLKRVSDVLENIDSIYEVRH